MEEESRTDSRERRQRVAKQLAFPRYSGTPGNLRAVELVSGWFREAGLEVSLEWFHYDVDPAFRALRLMLLLVAALLGLGAATVDSSPLWALFLVVIAVGGSGALLSWAPWLEKLYRGQGRTRAANVEGRRAGRQDGITVILLAHHDSKSQNLTLPFRAGFTLAAIVAGLGLLAVSTLETLFPTIEVSTGLGNALGVVAVVSLVALSTLRNGNKSPGGVDNAGSVGILVDLAHKLPRRVPEAVELVFLSPGAEEDHMVGAMRWLDNHEKDLAGRRVWALNIDGAGIPGRVTLLERYGFGKLFSPELSAVARSAASKLGIPVRGILIPPAMGVDAIPFAHRGIPCLTLTSGSLGRASLSVHSQNDRVEHLDDDVLGQVGDLVAAIALGLIEEPTHKEAGSEAPARMEGLDTA